MRKVSNFVGTYRSSRPKVFCKKGVLICQEGLALLVPVSYHQNRSIFPGRPNFYQEVIFTYEHLRISQEAAVQRTDTFSLEDVLFSEQLKIARKENHLQNRSVFPRTPNMPIFFRTGKIDRKVV